MLRLVLFTALLGIAGGVGFFYGKHLHPVAVPLPAETRAESRIGVPIQNLKLSDIQDTFNDARGQGARRHEATDIMAPRGTPVMAVTAGVVQKLFTSVPGGLTIYQFDTDAKYCYYYAHLDAYAAGMREGLQVQRGDVIGYVGSTGNADAAGPHLHFAILELGPDKAWWKDTKPLDPYPLLKQAISQAVSTPKRER